MDVNNLVHMANQIGSFFESMPDRQQAQQDIASHLKRFWAPRMRSALLQHIDQHGGDQLKDIVFQAIQANRSTLQ